jgi:hypothetical protein
MFAELRCAEPIPPLLLYVTTYTAGVQTAYKVIFAVGVYVAPTELPDVVVDHPLNELPVFDKPEPPMRVIAEVELDCTSVDFEGVPVPVLAL